MLAEASVLGDAVSNRSYVIGEIQVSYVVSADLEPIARAYCQSKDEVQDDYKDEWSEDIAL